MTKEQEAARIAEANAKEMTKINTHNGITVPVFQSWLQRTGKQEFGKKIIDLVEVLSEKLQFLLHGKPYIIEHEDETQQDQSKIPSNKKLGHFVEESMLQEAMFHNEKMLFLKGHSFIVIEKIGDAKSNKIQIRVAEPNFPNTVTRLGNIKIRAEIWTTFQYDRVNYFQRTVYTPEKIHNEVFTEKTNLDDVVPMNSRDGATNLKKLNSILPKHLQIMGIQKNPWGFIPVVEVQYKPSMDFSWRERDALAPANRVEKQQAFLDEATRALSLELYLNRTKILVDADMLAGADRETLKKVADENILGLIKDTGNLEGEQKAVEVIQGNPKITEYWENIKNIISVCVSALKLSELNEEQAAATTATGEIFNKGNDVETANTLQIFRQKAIAEIMEKATAMRDNRFFNEHEIDVSKWNIQLIPNVIMNEAKMTEIVTKQLQAGLISMVQAKVKLEGISHTDAETALQEAEEEQNLNPLRDAVSGFGDQNIGDPILGDDTGKEVDKGK